MKRAKRAGGTFREREPGSDPGSAFRGGEPGQAGVVTFAKYAEVFLAGHAKANSKNTLTVCEALLRRTCEAVALILDTVDELSVADVETGVAA